MTDTQIYDYSGRCDEPGLNDTN